MRIQNYHCAQSVVNIYYDSNSNTYDQPDESRQLRDAIQARRSSRDSRSFVKMIPFIYTFLNVFINPIYEANFLVRMQLLRTWDWAWNRALETTASWFQSSQQPRATWAHFGSPGTSSTRELLCVCVCVILNELKQR